MSQDIYDHCTTFSLWIMTLTIWHIMTYHDNMTTSHDAVYLLSYCSYYYITPTPFHCYLSFLTKLLRLDSTLTPGPFSSILRIICCFGSIIDLRVSLSYLIWIMVVAKLDFDTLRGYLTILRGYLDVLRGYLNILRGYLDALRGYLNILRGYLSTLRTLRKHLKKYMMIHKWKK